MSNVNNYEFLKVIGKGSYGEVHLVEHRKDRKQYVIKKLSVVKASQRERRAAEQEAKLLSSLRHPNIVAYKDSFANDDGFLYIVMGFAEGGDLYNKLRQQREKKEELSEQQVVRWFIQISMAMQYLHERRILHRDLKTQNIFLTKSNMIKVGDLGIARVLETTNDMATTLIGTPYYMSPELFQNKAYNHKSDVWALGCCAYEMITLRHAFNAKDMNSLVYKIIKGKLPKMPDSYSGSLCDLIKSMLHQLPEKRPSVNRILRNPFIKKHIQLFLDESSRRRRPNSGSSRPNSGSHRPGTVPTQTPSRPTNTRCNSEGAINEAGGRENVSPVKKHEEPKIVIEEETPSEAECSFKSESTLKATVKHKDDLKEDKLFENNISQEVDKIISKSKIAVNLPQPKAVLMPSPPETPRKREHSTSSNSSASNSSRRDRPLPKRPISAPKVRGEIKPTEASSKNKDLGSSLESNISTASMGSTARERRRQRKKKEREKKNELRQSNLGENLSKFSQVEANKDIHPQSTNEPTYLRKSESKSSITENDDFVDMLQTTLRIMSIEENDNQSSSSSSPTSEGSGQGDAPANNEVGDGDYRRNPSRGISNATLQSTNRLMDRIVELRKDCIQGLGVPLLHRAYEVFNSTEDDNEIEQRLTELLGPVRFELWAGKIWQMKFCEESMFNHCDTITAIHP